MSLCEKCGNRFSAVDYNGICPKCGNNQYINEEKRNRIEKLEGELKLYKNNLQEARERRFNEVSEKYDQRYKNFMTKLKKKEKEFDSLKIFNILQKKKVQEEIDQIRSKLKRISEIKEELPSFNKDLREREKKAFQIAQNQVEGFKLTCTLDGILEADEFTKLQAENRKLMPSILMVMENEGKPLTAYEVYSLMDMSNPNTKIYSAKIQRILFDLTKEGRVHCDKLKDDKETLRGDLFSLLPTADGIPLFEDPKEVMKIVPYSEAHRLLARKKQTMGDDYSTYIEQLCIKQGKNGIHKKLLKELNEEYRKGLMKSLEALSEAKKASDYSKHHDSAIIGGAVSAVAGSTAGVFAAYSAEKENRNNSIKRVEAEQKRDRLSIEAKNNRKKVDSIVQQLEAFETEIFRNSGKIK